MLLSPQVMELLQMMLKPVAVASPQVMESPHRMELESTVLLPQTSELLQMMELSQMMLLPQVMDVPLDKETLPVSGLRTATGEAAPPLTTSLLVRAASTSR